MAGYTILTNSKRTLVALAHSVAFLLLAARGIATIGRPLQAASPISAWAMFAVYLVVSSILLLLTAFSGPALERLYFAFCTTSASFGLLRSILGDPRMHVAVYVRVTMLLCATVTGTFIWRAYRLARAKPATEQG